MSPCVCDSCFMPASQLCTRGSEPCPPAMRATTWGPSGCSQPPDPAVCLQENLSGDHQAEALHRLASGLAPSVTLGGERGGGMWFPNVSAILLKSLNGKEWQERRDFSVARLHDGASCLPHSSAGTSGGGVMGG